MFFRDYKKKMTGNPMGQFRQSLKQLEAQVKQKTLELKQTQDRLIKLEKLASIGELTAGIAHEIKNSLNFINNFSLLSLESLRDFKSKINARIQLLPEEIEQLLTIEQNIQSTFDQGKKADNIIQRTLTHARFEKGVAIETDINRLVADYLDLISHHLFDFPVRIEKRLEPNLKLVTVISEDIGRVLLNLFNNALYAMRKKRELNPAYEPLLIVETKNLDKQIEIRVWDNGIGMSKEVMAGIFTPFFTTKPPGEGTGLGLSLSYNIIVQEHNGGIEFQTEEGNFTEFIIRLKMGFEAK